MSMVTRSSGRESAAIGVGVGGRQPVSNDRLSTTAAAVANTDGRRCTGGATASCYENVRSRAILRKDGMPTYGRRRLPETIEQNRRALCCWSCCRTGGGHYRGGIGETPFQRLQGLRWYEVLTDLTCLRPYREASPIH